MPDAPGCSTERNAYLVIIFIVLISSLIFYFPFLINASSIGPIEFPEKGMQVVYRYWDGPLYVIVSQTFYSSDSPLYEYVWLGAQYFPAHFPLYPFTILLLSFIGEFPAMIVSSVIFSCLSVLMFYKIAKEYAITRDPLFLTLFFCFFPLRWFLYQHVGATEPPFIFFCLATIYFLKKDHLHYSILFACLATLTRIFGIVLLPVLLVSLAIKHQLNLENFLKCMAIPLSIVALFSYYMFSLGDFFAYFNVNDEYIQEPLRVMITIVNYHFQELYAILLIVFLLSAIILWKRGEKEMALFIFCYLPVTMLIVHADAGRYMIPMAPFALMGFESVFPRNRIIFGAIIAFTALLAFIYAWTLLPHNLMAVETFTRINETMGIMDTVHIYEF